MDCVIFANWRGANEKRWKLISSMSDGFNLTEIDGSETRNLKFRGDFNSVF